MEYPTSELQKFYNDKTIFITGVTGFLGKALLEKLLKICHGVRKIYVLVRAKNGQSPDERMDEILTNPIFADAKVFNTNYKHQIHVISGDIEKPKLGINECDWKMLVNDVEIVINCAGTINFTKPLKTCILVNAKSTKDLIELAHEMQNLKCFTQISNAFAFYKAEPLDKKSILEEKYEILKPSGLEVVKTMEQLDDQAAAEKTPELLGNFVNNYTFSKAVAEDIVMQQGKGLPRTILRPSILLSGHTDPLRGWIDTKNKVVQSAIMTARGLVHISYGDPKASISIMPVDFVANGALIATWDKINTIKENLESFNDVPIQAMCSTNRNHFNMADFSFWGSRIIHTMSTNYRIWHPWGGITNIYWLFVLMWYAFHMIPGYFIDVILNAMGYDPFVMKYYKYVLKNTHILKHFNKRYLVRDDNFFQLWEKLTDMDKELFFCDIATVNLHKYFFFASWGARKYLLKEKLDVSRHFKFAIFIADAIRIVHYVIIATLFYVLYMIPRWFICEELYIAYYFVVGGVICFYNWAVKCPYFY